MCFRMGFDLNHDRDAGSVNGERHKCELVIASVVLHLVLTAPHRASFI
jgi:hypothetical protein